MDRLKSKIVLTNFDVIMLTRSLARNNLKIKYISMAVIQIKKQAMTSSPRPDTIAERLGNNSRITINKKVFEIIVKLKSAQ